MPAAAGPEFAPVRDGSRLVDVRERYDLPEGDYLLMVVKGYASVRRPGKQLYPGKNLEGALRAYEEVCTRLPHALPLVVAGPGLEREEVLRTIPVSERVAERLFVIGYVDHADMAALYSMARALLFPSWAESFGIPILEAMASDCPVITSTWGACPEVAGEAAILVDPTDESEIADAIETVLLDQRHVAALREKGRRRAQQFSWPRTAAALLSHLAEAAGGRDGRAH